MKKIVVFLFIFAIFPIFGCQPATIDESVDMTPRLISSTQVLSSSQIVEEVKSAIVGISCSLSGGTSIGSGVAIAKGGYVLTNQHVVSGAKKISLYLANQSVVSASYVWGDSALDIAVLKADSDLPYLDFAPLSDVSVGDDVLAVGTPISLQFQHSVTKGIVSALNRTLEFQSLGGYTTYMQNLIQHDASINSGNSGGPLINSMGKVIGINSLKATDAEGIGFAIPIENAMSAIKQILPNGSFEQVKLGVLACDCSVANFKNLTQNKNGVYVLDVENNSFVSNSGIKNGDVILEINGKKIDGMISFRDVVYSLKPQQKITIKYVQDGVEKYFFG